MVVVSRQNCRPRDPGIVCPLTRESWTCERRVVGKAEYLAKGENPRFIVTSLAVEDWEARALYEDLYCARGEMENRIKEQQLQLFADRTSTHALDSNQLRLYFSSFAYVLIETLRALGLSGTELAQAQCSTIRLKLLAIVHYLTDRDLIKDHAGDRPGS